MKLKMLAAFVVIAFSLGACGGAETASETASETAATEVVNGVKTPAKVKLVPSN